MINVATVGVHIHKAARPRPGGRPSALINKASPTAMSSTSTEKMAALLVSVSVVNIPQNPLPSPKSQRGVPTFHAICQLLTPQYFARGMQGFNVTFLTQKECPRGRWRVAGFRESLTSATELPGIAISRHPPPCIFTLGLPRSATLTLSRHPGGWGEKTDRGCCAPTRRRFAFLRRSAGV